MLSLTMLCASFSYIKPPFSLSYTYLCHETSLYHHEASYYAQESRGLGERIEEVRVVCSEVEERVDV